MNKPKMSYSRVSVFKRCPLKYRMRYLDGLSVAPSQDPYDALYLGRAIHKAIESGPDAGVEAYRDNFYITSDIIEALSCQVAYWGEHIWDYLPDGGQHEIELKCMMKNGCEFIGYADYVVGDSLFDFKVTNYPASFSPTQLFLYKHFWDELHPDQPIKHLYYVFIPKVLIRKRKGESSEQFRQRMIDEVAKKCPVVQEIRNWDEITIQHEVDCFYHDTSFIMGAHEGTVPCVIPEYTKQCERFCNYYELCCFNDQSEIENFDELSDDRKEFYLSRPLPAPLF